MIELLGRAPHRASELARAVDASRPGMSRHLRVLREAGLVREEGDERDARARVYRLEREAFGGVQGWLEDVESFWADQLASLREHVEAQGAHARWLSPAPSPTARASRFASPRRATSCSRSFTEEIDAWWRHGKRFRLGASRA